MKESGKKTYNVNMESLKGGKNTLGTRNTQYIQTEAKKTKELEEDSSYTITKNLCTRTASN